MYVKKIIEKIISYSFCFLVPDNCSELFQQVIESLFITHAECKLNEWGHLVSESIIPKSELHGPWCANLTRHLLSSFF
jgi:hypothetical protein